MNFHGPSVLAPVARYELRFRSLFDAGRALAFPCDANGKVDESTLSERARSNYERARKVIGKEWATPMVMLRA